MRSSKDCRSNAPVIDWWWYFSSKFKEVLNPDYNLDSSPRSDPFLGIRSSLCDSDLASTLVSPVTVSEALSHLKMNKSDGANLSSNHFICASTTLIDFLSKLYTAMLHHRHVPKSLHGCSLQPILKFGKDSSNSDAAPILFIARMLHT